MHTVFLAASRPWGWTRDRLGHRDEQQQGEDVSHPDEHKHKAATCRHARDIHDLKSHGD